uniref:Integrase catalytic domain-containing protein n=1 Tax=Tanacetum cinerariifolium TaxID=118510 RepID=A0A699GNQ9_TANCI|nr:hypothetical protein [Tanacetum cinerariifolium]
MIDYALLEVIENDTTLPKTQVVEGVTIELKFNSIKDATKLLEAIENRFSRNAATKKTKRNILKQQYENFTAPSLEMRDQTFDRLHNLLSQLELLVEKISQEDVNQKLLRSLSPEWNTHVVVWRNKVDLETMSIDDVCNNLKVQPNSLQPVHEDLEQIHPDDMEEMDLRWKMLMLTMRDRGALRNQDNKHTESSRRSMLVETSASISLVSCDGLGGYDWSDQAEKGPNYALMDFSSSSSNSKVSNDSTCSKYCLETIKLLKSQNDQLLKDLKKFELMVLGEIAIRELRKKLKIALKEKDDIQLNLDKFKHASKSLNKLIECQIVDNYKKGLGYENYNAVLPPYKRNFMPLTPDLSFNSLDEFVNKPVVENCKAKSSEEEPKVFFLSTKDETSGILKSFISRIENLVDHKVKVIRCDNETEFKNREMNQFCEMKGILRQFSVARTLQQNRVAKRRNTTIIEAGRTMLADSKLPTTFWAEAVNTACYVQNKVLLVKPHNKTIYELFHGRTSTLSFMRPFGCPVTILNTIDRLGKFNGKADEGFFVGYSLNSKAFIVFNSRTRIVEENLHIRFSESTPNVVVSGLDWLFDIDALTRIMNYEPIISGTQSNNFTGTKASDNASQSSHDDGSKPSCDDGKKVDEDPRKESKCKDQEKEDNVNSTNNVTTVSSTVNVAGKNEDNELPVDLNMPALEDVNIFNFSSDDEDDGTLAHMNNLDITIQVSPILTTRIHKDHTLNQVIRDLQSTTQTRKMSNNLEEHGFVSTIQQRTNHKDL